jgi:hypothetical protein
MKASSIRQVSISAGPRNPIAEFDSALTGARNSPESMITDEISLRLAGWLGTMLRQTFIRVQV